MKKILGWLVFAIVVIIGSSLLQGRVAEQWMVVVGAALFSVALLGIMQQIKKICQEIIRVQRS